MLIYLDVPLEERLSRDEGTKGVYKKLKSQDVQYDIPSAPDLSIKNFGDITPEISAQLIRDHMKKFVQMHHQIKEEPNTGTSFTLMVIFLNSHHLSLNGFLRV